MKSKNNTLVKKCYWNNFIAICIFLGRVPLLGCVSLGIPENGHRRSRGFLTTKETKVHFWIIFVMSHEILLNYETMNGVTIHCNGHLKSISVVQNLCKLYSSEVSTNAQDILSDFGSNFLKKDSIENLPLSVTHASNWCDSYFQQLNVLFLDLFSKKCTDHESFRFELLNPLRVWILWIHNSC